MMDKKQTPFERIGGRLKVREVGKVFYDKVYMDPWLGQYFQNIPQDHLENQQADFIIGCLNGPKEYSGRAPEFAHEHMMITEELFDLRNQLLLEALVECKIPEDLQALWLKIDNSFRRVIVKKGLDDCKARYFTDSILNFSKPKSAA